jgi:3',5'-cyclic AMP phosphodiesterase CpdA
LRTIAHISDLHFGRIDTLLPAALQNALLGVKPNVVVVSGDLTQRARRTEFAAARAFLDALPFPQVVVPGNHDVPLHNILRRWLSPLESYRQYINSDVEPSYFDDEIAIQGLNTARSLTWKNGRINRTQVEQTCARLASAQRDVTRIVVTHHPFELPGDRFDGSLVGRAEMAMSAFAACRVDMILSGHFHIGHATSQTQRYPGLSRAAILVQAGTAVSSRRRDEGNSWNLIRIDRPSVIVERHTWQPSIERFRVSSREAFQLAAAGWTAVTQPVHDSAQGA